MAIRSLLALEVLELSIGVLRQQAVPVLFQWLLTEEAKEKEEWRRGGEGTRVRSNDQEHAYYIKMDSHLGSSKYKYLGKAIFISFPP